MICLRRGQPPFFLIFGLASVVLAATAASSLVGRAQPDPTGGAEPTGVSPASETTADGEDRAATGSTIQPIAFSHRQHVADLGLDCQMCHVYARRSPVAGIPSVETCVGCHRQALSDRPEIEALLQFWETEEPIPWIRVHDLPDFTRFSHQRHLRNGVDCATCHGDVGQMGFAVQVESLSMGWCVTCHEERGAPLDCLTCHY